MADALPNFTLEVSLESHDPVVRRAFGKHYDNEPIERTIADTRSTWARAAGRLLHGRAAAADRRVSARHHRLLRGSAAPLRRDGRLIPFISPLAPFLDPGSRGFENPDEHGYRLFARTLEDHRRRLGAPSWKYVLNYETNWMTRDQLVDATYAAGRRLNRIKADYGLVSMAQAQATEVRIDRAVEISAEIDQLMASATPDRFHVEMERLKAEIDQVNMSTVCDKRELNVEFSGPKLRYGEVARMLVEDTLRTLGRRLTPARFRVSNSGL